MGKNLYEELEEIVRFAERQGVNQYDVCIVYGRFKAVNEAEALNRTMEWIYRQNEIKH